MANLNIPATRDRTLDAFKGKMIGGGARSNLFECELYFPDDAIPRDSTKDSISDKVRFLVKAAALPASTISNISIPFRGRNLKIAGDRTFDPWTITIQNDSGFKLRTAFETWMQKIQEYDENYTAVATSTTSTSNTVGYFADMDVHQLSRNEKGTASGTTGGQDTSHKVIKSYKFFQCFPSNIAAIDLDFGNNDAVEEFTVELQVQYWKPTAVAS